MELFLLFAIAITVVAFIPIVLAEPIASLHPTNLVEIELNSIQLESIPTDRSIELIAMPIQEFNWENQGTSFLALKEF